MRKLVRTERKVTHLVVIHIAEIEARKLYADLGFDGMYSYLTQVQKCLKESSRNGESISVEQTLGVLAKLENKNSFETQKTFALKMNLPVEPHEKSKTSTR